MGHHYFQKGGGKYFGGGSDKIWEPSDGCNEKNQVTSDKHQLINSGQIALYYYK